MLAAKTTSPPAGKLLAGMPSATALELFTRPAIRQMEGPSGPLSVETTRASTPRMIADAATTSRRMTRQGLPAEAQPLKS